MARLQDYVDEVPEERSKLQETEKQVPILRLAATQPNITPAEAARIIKEEEGFSVDNSTVIRTLRHATEELISKYDPKAHTESEGHLSSEGREEYHVHSQDNADLEELVRKIEAEK